MRIYWLTLRYASGQEVTQGYSSKLARRVMLILTSSYAVCVAQGTREL